MTQPEPPPRWYAGHESPQAAAIRQQAEAKRNEGATWAERLAAKYERCKLTADWWKEMRNKC